MNILVYSQSVPAEAIFPQKYNIFVDCYSKIWATFPRSVQ